MKTLSILLSLALSFALFAACSGGEGGEGSPSDFPEDDDDDDAIGAAWLGAPDDDDDDDDDETSCAVVWLECEYENPWDSEPTECGDAPTSYPWSPWADWNSCRYTWWEGWAASIAECGIGFGCEDWKYDRYSCVSEIYGGYASCYENSSDVDEYAECEGLLQDVDCNDI